MWKVIANRIRANEDIVDAYSPTGHDYLHFSRDDFEKDLRGVGFTEVDVLTSYDPITIVAPEAQQARERMLWYVRNAYGLTPPGGGADDTELLSWVDSLLTANLRYSGQDFAGLASVPEPVRSNGTLTVYESATGWTAELPRLALVAIATKSA